MIKILRGLYVMNHVANVLNCEVVESEFKLQSHYYVYFMINSFEKGIDSLISPDIGKIIPLLSYNGNFDS